MPTVTIKVELPPESQAIIRGLKTLPQEIPQAIKRGMDRALSIVRGRIQENRLSGKGPFPPSQGKLGERSGLMRGSLREIPAVIQGNTITGAIESPMRRYASVHEFGMTIKGKPLMRFQIEGKWISARQVVIPERAPVRRGVTENVDFIAGEIGSEIEKSFEKPSK